MRPLVVRRAKPDRRLVPPELPWSARVPHVVGIALCCAIYSVPWLICGGLLVWWVMRGPL